MAPAATVGEEGVMVMLCNTGLVKNPEQETVSSSIGSKAAIPVSRSERSINRMKAMMRLAQPYAAASATAELDQLCREATVVATASVARMGRRRRMAVPWPWRLSTIIPAVSP